MELWKYANMKIWKYENAGWVLKTLGISIFAYFHTFTIASASAEAAHDIVIYGSSPAAISAAVQAVRMGESEYVVGGNFLFHGQEITIA